jgi:hypothetical protein
MMMASSARTRTYVDVRGESPSRSGFSVPGSDFEFKFRVLDSEFDFPLLSSNF